MRKAIERFWAGFLGSLILIAVMYLMEIFRLTGNPGFVAIYHAVFGNHYFLIDNLMAALLFAISGGIWGMVFGLVPHPTPVRGIFFGLAPSFWLWVVVLPFVGDPFFSGFTLRGILWPLVLNCLIWGAFVGWYCKTYVDPPRERIIG